MSKVRFKQNKYGYDVFIKEETWITMSWVNYFKFRVHYDKKNIKEIFYKRWGVLLRLEKSLNLPTIKYKNKLGSHLMEIVYTAVIKKKKIINYHKKKICMVNIDWFVERGYLWKHSFEGVGVEFSKDCLVISFSLEEAVLATELLKIKMEMIEEEKKCVLIMGAEEKDVENLHAVEILKYIVESEESRFSFRLSAKGLEGYRFKVTYPETSNKRKDYYLDKISSQNK